MADAVRTLQFVKQQRTHSRAQWQKRIEQLRSQRLAFDNKLAQTLAASKLRNVLYKRRLRQQSLNAHRRLQELLFECIGELAKASRRSKMRTQDISSDVNQEMDDAYSKLAWKSFLLRMSEDLLRAVQCTDLGEQMSEGIAQKACDHVTQLLQRYLMDSDGPDSGGQVRVRRLVEVRMQQQTSSRRRQPPPRESMFTELVGSDSSSNAAEQGKNGNIAELMARAVRGCNRSKSASSSSASASSSSPAAMYQRLIRPGVARSPDYPATMLLSSRTLTWILSHPSSWGSEPNCSLGPIGSHVYYCIEERVLAKLSLSVSDKAETARQAKALGENGKAEGKAETAVIAHAVHHFLAQVYGVDAASAGVRAVLRRERTEESGRSVHSSGSGAASASATRADGDPPAAGWRVVASSSKHRQGGQPQQLALSTAGLGGGAANGEIDERIKDVLCSFPDVLVAEADNPDNDGTTVRLHFACASLLQLVETVVCDAVLAVALSPTEKADVQARFPPNLVQRSLLHHMYVPMAAPVAIPSLEELNSANQGGGDAEGEGSMLRRPVTLVDLPSQFRQAVPAHNPLASNSRMRTLTSTCIRELVAMHVVRVGASGGESGGAGKQQEGDESNGGGLPTNPTIAMPNATDILPLNQGYSGPQQVTDDGRTRCCLLLQPNLIQSVHDLVQQAKSEDEAKANKKREKDKKRQQSDKGTMGSMKGNMLIDRRWGFTRDGVRTGNKGDEDDDKEKAAPPPSVYMLEVELEKEGSLEGADAETGRKLSASTPPVPPLKELCTWRSCLCTADNITVARTGGTGTAGGGGRRGSDKKGRSGVTDLVGGVASIPLCSHCSELKDFLDGLPRKRGQLSETARYLPRNGPGSGAGDSSRKSRPQSGVKSATAATAADLQAIQSNSSLLQELASGKLAATIATFCRRAAANASERNTSTAQGGRASGRGAKDIKAVQAKQEVLEKERKLSRQVGARAHDHAMHHACCSIRRHAHTHCGILPPRIAIISSLPSSPHDFWLTHRCASRRSV
jgi:hypothetical protein